MRTSALVVALPALAAAQQWQEQIPFINEIKSFLGQASASVSSASPSAPSAPSIPNPIASGAKVVAAANVERLTVDNWNTLLKPGAATASPGIEDWMVFVTGGNKTCFGTCYRSEAAWNESTALISASSSPPKLAMLDCETDPVLCNAWALGPPSVLYMQLPQPLPDQSTPATTVRSISLNRTTVTAPEIAALSLQEKYKETEPYEGIFHPFNGWLADFGLNVPVGYALHYLNMIPSWMFMIGISFASRTIMSRRMNAGPTPRPGAAPASGAAPAAAS